MENKSKKEKSVVFYNKRWFWAIIILVLICTCLVFLIKDIDIRTTMTGVLSIWASGCATLFVGIIAERQNERFEFRNRKENIIKEIRDEERLFLIEFNEVCTPAKYIKLVDDILAQNYDEVGELTTLAYHCQMIEDLMRFMCNIGTYEYCPIFAGDLVKKINDMILYLQNELNPSKVSPLKKGYIKKVKKFPKNIIDWCYEARNIKFNCIASYQLLISLVNKCETLEALNKQVDRINVKSQKFREEIFLMDLFENSTNKTIK